jgi:hypothetical protein
VGPLWVPLSAARAALIAFAWRVGREATRGRFGASSSPLSTGSIAA